MNHFLRRCLSGACLLPLLLTGCDAERSIARSNQGAKSVVNICAVGDIILSQTVMDSAQNSAGAYDFSPAFQAVAGHLSTADLTLGNLEGNFCGAPYSAATHNYPEQLAEALSAAGVDILQTANTCTVENGTAGLRSTLSYLEAAGIQPVGSYASAEDRAENGVIIREINGLRIAILAFTKGVGNVRLPDGADYCTNLLYTDYDSSYTHIDTNTIDACVAEAVLQQPDAIIAMVHWGSEYSREISNSQTRIEQRLFYDGVDVILGTHSHLAGEISTQEITDKTGRTKTVLTAYSLGNFYGDDTDSRSAPSVMLDFTFTKYSDGITELTDWQYTPTYFADFGETAAQRFRVLDVKNSLALYQNYYYDAVPEELYEKLKTIPESLKSRITPEKETEETE